MASLRTTGAVALVLLLLTITFIVLGIGNSALAGTASVTNGTIKLGGYIGLATAIVAWYTSFAGVINSMSPRPILFVGTPMWGAPPEMARPGGPLPRREVSG